MSRTRASRLGRLGQLDPEVELTRPYVILKDPRDGSEPLLSSNVLNVLNDQLIHHVETTAYDIGQVLLAAGNDKSVISLRNLIRAACVRVRRKARSAFLLPAEDVVSDADEILQTFVATLQDRDVEKLERLNTSSNREGMDVVSHGTYILLVFDTLMDELVEQLVELFIILVMVHDARDTIAPLLTQVVADQRLVFRADLRRKGLWV